MIRPEREKPPDARLIRGLSCRIQVLCPVQLSTMLDVGLKDRPDDLMSLEGTWSWFELE